MEGQNSMNNAFIEHNKLRDNMWYLSYLVDRCEELKNVHTEKSTNLFRKIANAFSAHNKRANIKSNIIWVLEDNTDLVIDAINEYINRHWLYPETIKE